MVLEGKVALVTGSTSGIGLAIAKALAAEGARLMINGFGDPAGIERNVPNLARSTTAPTCRSRKRSSAMMKRCADELGGPDILVNNAGIQHVSPVEDFPPDKWDAIIAINLSVGVPHDPPRGPSMKREEMGPDHQHGERPQPCRLAVQERLCGGEARHRRLHQDGRAGDRARRDHRQLHLSGLRWTPLVEKQIPDTMRTRGLTREQVMNDVLLAAQPTKRFVTPEEVAALALFLCRDEAASITGTNLSMDGGWTAA